MSIVMFEAKEFEVAVVPEDLRQVMVFEPRVMAEAAADYPDCTHAVIDVESMVTDRQLNQLPKLAGIVTRSTGTDHITREAVRRGITIKPIEYCTEAVAEYTIAQLLYLARGRQLRVGTHQAGMGQELDGRVAGVFGAGRIGQRVARSLEALGCHVLVYDAQPMADFEQTSIDEIIEKATVLTFHIPGDAGQILGEAELSRVLPGTLLVNNARSVLLDLEALLRAIASGRIEAAALDVGPWEADPSWRERPDVQELVSSGSLVLTDHLAWATDRALEKNMAQVCDAVREWSGKLVTA
jgi:D-lactate dehydrogenase